MHTAERIAAAGACVAVLLPGSAARAQSPTFADIAPLVYEHCASCHHPGGDGPFSLISYDDVRRRGKQIVAATRQGYMPPWQPAPGSGPFLGERRLPEAEVDLLQRWVDAGAPEGSAVPAPPHFAGGWLHGEPDLIVTLPSYTLQADGADTFRNFVVTVPGRGPKYVRTFQFRPGNRAVHHANIRIDPTPASRRLDERDPAPGYEGVILNSAVYPDGHFLGWTPGQAPPRGSRDLSWRLDGGADLVVQLHMQPTGKPETIAPEIGLYFSGEPPASTPVILRLGRQNLDIAAGDANYHVSDSFVLPVDTALLAVQPHAHFRARRVTAIAALPDHTRRTLIDIPDWDFRWQDQYRYAQPVALPAGTTLQIDCTFDNSAENLRNPDRPPQRVGWGWRSIDEMGDVWFQLQAPTDDDRDRLAALARRKMAVEQAIGAEVLVTRNPDHINLRNDAAVTYLELGQPEDALRHFAVVTRLTPESAPAWYNEGVALQGAGRRDEAMARYRKAIELDPSYSLARNNLGNLLAMDGRHADAIVWYRQALAADPSNADAHCSLAHSLLLTERPEAAAAEFDRALQIRPDWPACASVYVWMLSAHRHAAVRNPAKAIALAERMVAATRRRDAEAFDALAAAYAAAGRFDEAVSAATMARRLVEGNRARASAIDERLALYQRHQPFVIPD